MPVKVSKIGRGFQVRTPKMIHAKKTTKKKAMAQKRLLNAIDAGWQPTKRRKKK